MIFNFFTIKFFRKTSKIFTTIHKKLVVLLIYDSKLIDRKNTSELLSPILSKKSYIQKVLTQFSYFFNSKVLIDTVYY